MRARWRCMSASSSLITSASLSLSLAASCTARSRARSIAARTCCLSRSAPAARAASRAAAPAAAPGASLAAACWASTRAAAAALAAASGSGRRSPAAGLGGARSASSQSRGLIRTARARSRSRRASRWRPWNSRMLASGSRAAAAAAAAAAATDAGVMRTAWAGLITMRTPAMPSTTNAPRPPTVVSGCGLSGCVARGRAAAPSACASDVTSCRAKPCTVTHPGGSAAVPAVFLRCTAYSIRAAASASPG
mmetsp:Transcript_17700/g.44568  ORF Transcript_17700/g.44568 Transcript_17700/m.44568 type:complete len:250 (+) Transcript_17700:602-1351(+)